MPGTGRVVIKTLSRVTKKGTSCPCYIIDNIFVVFMLVNYFGNWHPGEESHKKHGHIFGVVTLQGAYFVKDNYLLGSYR